MSKTTSTFRLAKSSNTVTQFVTHKIEKQESRTLSRFQALGYLLCRVDTIAAGGSHFGKLISAMLSFGAEVDALGFDQYDPVHVLSSPNWKIRMRAAWCVMSPEDRTIATQLDYDSLHNYWPNDDFCHSDWEDQVQQWAWQDEPYKQPVELRIASVVGDPPRARLIYKAKPQRSSHTPCLNGKPTGSTQGT